MAKPALGRGLGALLGGVVTPARSVATSPPAIHATSTVPTISAGEVVRLVPLNRIRPSPLQPRKDFAAEALRELADSIKEQGIVQPLLARERDGQFELIAGERRWRAAQLAGLDQAPVIVREADDRLTLELALIENLQRENLNPMEEALGYRELTEQFHLTQEEVAAKVGKSRVGVANSLRLLSLPPEVQTWLRDGRLTVGHAKVILGLRSNSEQKLASERVVKDGLTVRQTEDLVSHWLARAAEPGTPAARVAGQTPTRDAHVVAMENRLRERMGTKVGLRYRQGKGSVEIRFYSDDELERILQVMGVALE